MKNNFEYWINSKGFVFYIFYWIFYFAFFLSGIMVSMKTNNPFAFVFIGICPYFVILVYRGIHSPFKSLEEGIQKYDLSLHDQLSQSIPDKYNQYPKQRAKYMLINLVKLSEEGMNTKIVAFKKNYNRVNSTIDISLMLWFISIFILGGYLYSIR